MKVLAWHACNYRLNLNGLLCPGAQVRIRWFTARTVACDALLTRFAFLCTCERGVRIGKITIGIEVIRFGFVEFWR